MANYLDEAGLQEVWGLIKERDAAALEAALAAGAKFETGSYKGANAKSKTLTFGFVPKVVFITGTNGAHSQIGILIQGAASALSYISEGSGDNYACELTWSGNSVTTYNSRASKYAFNESSSCTYNYCAIG